MTANPAPWDRRHLLGLEDLSAGDITALLDLARELAPHSTRSSRKLAALAGRTVVTMFYENSTRTQLSFQLAAQRLSADVLPFTKAGASVAKGESLLDTVRNIEAMGVDCMVLRHPAAGAAARVASRVQCSVVNAGDGQHEHPTQALLDLYTLREVLQERRDPRGIGDLTVAVVGDLQHSRVARSNLWGLRRLGARVLAVGPATLVPSGFREMGAVICHDLDEALGQADAVNMLRVQYERHEGQAGFPPRAEYVRRWGLTRERLDRAKPDLIVMHPGPVNRGFEVSPEVADGPRSVILRQVRNGLAVRMAVLRTVLAAP